MNGENEDLACLINDSNENEKVVSDLNSEPVFTKNVSNFSEVEPFFQKQVSYEEPVFNRELRVDSCEEILTSPIVTPYSMQKPFQPQTAASLYQK